MWLQAGLNSGLATLPLFGSVGWAASCGDGRAETCDGKGWLRGHSLNALEKWVPRVRFITDIRDIRRCGMHSVKYRIIHYVDIPGNGISWFQPYPWGLFLLFFPFPCAGKVLEVQVVRVRYGNRESCSILQATAGAHTFASGGFSQYSPV